MISKAVTSAYERRIRERWQEIEPFLLARLKSLPDHPTGGFLSTVAALKETHREAIVMMLRRDQIPFRMIRKYSLDDPLLTNEARAEQIRNVQERRRRHPGKTPSLGRSGNRRPAAILPGDL